MPTTRLPTRLLWLLALCFGVTSSLASNIDAIRQELILPSNGPAGRPLPVVSVWNIGNTFDWQIQKLNEGHYILPTFWMPGPDSNEGTITYAKDFVTQLATWNLPVALKSTQWEDSLVLDWKFTSLPFETNPGAFDLDMNPMHRVDPDAPSLVPFQELGSDWGGSGGMQAYQLWYPDPPKVILLSNNEGRWLRRQDLTRSFRFVQNWGTQPSDVDRMFDSGCEIGWSSSPTIGITQAMRIAANEALTSWRDNVIFVPFGGLGPRHYGRWSFWKDYSGAGANWLDCSYHTWDGASPDYYLDNWSAIRDDQGWSPQVEAQNWLPVLAEAYEKNPEFWLEFSIWDGNEAKRSALSDVEPFSEARYAAIAKFGLWLLRPRVIREFRSHLDNNSPTYSEALLEAVKAIHENPEVAEFWRFGTLVPNRSRSHFYNVNELPKYPSADRWFLLEASANSGSWSLYGRQKIFALAISLGMAPNEKFLLYAHAPQGSMNDVQIDIPGHGSVVVDVPLSGAYYIVEASGAVRPVSEISGDARFLNAAPLVLSNGEIDGPFGFVCKVSDPDGSTDVQEVEVWVGDNPEIGSGCHFKFHPASGGTYQRDSSAGKWVPVGGGAWIDGCLLESSSIAVEDFGLELNIHMPIALATRPQSVHVRATDGFGSRSSWMNVGEANPEIGHWALDENFEEGVSVLKDSFGNGFDGTLHGTGTQSVQGVLGSAVSFDGRTGYATVQKGNRAIGGFTFSAWLKPRKLPNSLSIVYSELRSSPTVVGWAIGLASDGRVFTTVADGGNTPWAVTEGRLREGEWTHVVVTFDRQTGRIRFYLNGGLDAVTGFNIAELDLGITPTIAKASWTNSYFYDGALDDLKLQHGVLTENDVSALFSAYPAPPSADLPPSAVAIWSLDETSDGPGITLVDETALGHDAVTQGGGGVAHSGVIGGARRFNGFDDFATVMGGAGAFSGPFTLTAWVQLHRLPESFGVLLSTLDNGSVLGGWFVGIDSAGRVVGSVAGNGRTPWLLSNSGLALDEWSHVTVSFDDTSRRMIIYVNGVRTASAVFPAVDLASIVPPSIGRASWTNSYYLPASIDDLRIYDSELSAQQVSEQYSSVVPPPPGEGATPTAAWSLDEAGAGPGVLLQDSTGNAWHATTAGGGTTSGAGVLGSARRFNGLDDYATVDGATFSGSFSLSGWVRSDGAPSSVAVIFSTLQTSPALSGWAVGLSSEGRIFGTVAGSSGTPWLLSNSALNAGSWHYVTVTFEAGSRRMIIYIDGIRETSAVFPSAYLDATVTPTVGRASWAGTYYFYGSLDELGIYDSELSAQQVSDLLGSQVAN